MRHARARALRLAPCPASLAAPASEAELALLQPMEVLHAHPVTDSHVAGSQIPLLFPARSRFGAISYRASESRASNARADRSTKAREWSVSRLPAGRPASPQGLARRAEG